MAFSTIPTPLYTIYQASLGFPTWISTVIFGAYAVGVMAALYFAGHISDWYGRRRVILVFLFWPVVPGLLVARFFNGLGIGLLTSTATAHLVELRAVSHPHTNSSVPSLVSTVALPHALFLILLVPETVTPPERQPAYRPQKLALVPAHRGTFYAAAASTFGAFAILGMFTSLSPVFLAKDLHESSKFVAGAVTFAALGAGTLAQVALSGLKARTQLVLGLIAITAGLGAVTTGVSLVLAPAFLAGGVLAGVGLVFRTAIQMVAKVAPPATRAGVLASIFLIGFAGLTVPVLGLGVALQFVSGPVALAVFATVILVLSLWSGVKMAQRLR